MNSMGGFSIYIYTLRIIKICSLELSNMYMICVYIYIIFKIITVYNYIICEIIL